MGKPRYGGVLVSKDSQSLSREMLAGVFALALMWAAYWVLVTLRYSSFAAGGDYVDVFVECASVGQIVSLAVSVMRFERAVACLRSWGLTVALAVVAALSFGCALFGGFQSIGLSVVLGMMLGCALGVLWVGAALFLSDQEPRRVALSLAVGALAGSAFLVGCLLLVPLAGAVLAVALAPASLVLFRVFWGFRSAAGSVPDIETERREWSMRANVRDYSGVYLVILVFGLVFGLQIGLGVDASDLPLAVTGGVFALPGVTLLVIRFGMKRPVNLRTLCLAILLSAVAALLPWLSGGGLSGMVRTLVVFVTFTLFDLSSMATLVEVGGANVFGRSVSVVMGRLAVMVSVTAGMLVAALLSCGDGDSTLVNSLAILALIAVFSRFTLMREMLSSRVVTEGLSDLDRAVDAVRARARLTERERDVVLFLAKGYNVKRVSEELTLSPNTVKTHQYHAYAKLGVHTHQELIRLVEEEVARLARE